MALDEQEMDRKKRLEVEDLYARATFGSLLEAIKTSQQTQRRLGRTLPTFAVLTEAGQTVLNEEGPACELGASLSLLLKGTAIVVQIIQLSHTKQESQK